MAIFEIPLNPFSECFEIEIEGQKYTFKTRWNPFLKRWVLDLCRSKNDCLISNLAMVACTDLAYQYEHLKLGWKFVLQVDGQPESEADEKNLGKEARLLVITND